MISRVALVLSAAILAGSVSIAHPPGHHSPAKGSPLPQPEPAGPPQTGDYVWPERLQNAKVLPADLGAERLRRTMVGFSRQLGVRCLYCHVGEEGAPLSQLDFVSDANPHKDVARGMLRMNQQINGQLLPAMIGPAPQGAGARVTCFTCHRGKPIPDKQPPAPQGQPGATPAPTPPPTPPHAHIAPDTPAKPH